MSASNPFALTNYTVRRKIFNFWHRKFHIYGPDEQLVFYTEMKAFKLKEDIRIYSDENKSKELLIIKARKILDLSSAYDVFDAASNVKVGALKRQGLASTLVMDTWDILNAQDQPIGKIMEDSWILGIIRRYFIKIIPQTYNVTIGDRQIIQFKQNFNPFLLKLNLDFSQDQAQALDRRLGIAAAVLLCAIEGRQG